MGVVSLQFPEMVIAIARDSRSRILIIVVNLRASGVLFCVFIRCDSFGDPPVRTKTHLASDFEGGL